MSGASDELKAEVFDRLPQAILIADGEGGILLRNETACRLLPDGLKLLDLFGPAGIIDWQASLAQAAEGGGVFHPNVSLPGRGGRLLSVDVHLRRIEGEPPRVLVVLADVSERLSMERRVAAAERLAGEGAAAAKIAHELNNPLDGVMRFLGLAERTAGPRAQEYLQGARTGLTRMAEIVRQALYKGGRRGLIGGRACPIETLLEEAVGVMQPRAMALGVRVGCDAPPEVSVPADAAVFQVFCNVIKNALDAMPDGGRLDVRARRGEKDVAIEFADTGTGLPEPAERIFEPFFTTKPSGEGMGLGLTICREILARCGGSIAAAPREGGGAVVTVRLPAGPPAPQGGAT